jgi:phosphoserine phosphatase
MSTAPIVVTDMDGTLTTAETWRAVLAWIAEHHPSPAARRFVAMRLPVVALTKLGLYDREAFRARWMRDLARLLRGLSAEQVTGMGEWIVERHLWPARRQAGVDAVAAAMSHASAVDGTADLVLATGAYQPVADAFGRRIGAALALGTPLELRDGIATGRLALPVQSGDQKAAAVREHAAGRDVVAAFGDSEADIPLLRQAHRPVAIAPDARLRRAAVASGWEIIEPA